MANETLKKRLVAREEELVDLFLQEADPALLPGPNEFNHVRRAYKQKEVALRTLDLIEKIDALVRGEVPRRSSPVYDDVDEEEAAQEEEANQLMHQLQQTTKSITGKRSNRKDAHGGREDDRDNS